MTTRSPRRPLLAATTVLASLALVLPGTSPASAARADHLAGSARHTTSTTVALPDGLRPEGIESGPGTRFYVGSLADGRILTGDLRRGAPTVLLPGAEGRQIRGLYLDRRSGLLWAVGNVGAEAHVWAVDARSGAVVRDVVVDGAGFLNDLVVTRTSVWVTDSQSDRLTRVPLGRGGRAGTAAPEFLPLIGAWPQVTSGFRANGIRDLGRGYLVLNHSTAGGLWAVDSRTGVAHAISVTGGPAITGGDGIERRGRTLWVVRGATSTSVAELRVSYRRGTWSARWTDLLTDPSLDVPSTATVAAGSLWAVNARFGVPSMDTAPYWVTRLPLQR